MSVDLKSPTRRTTAGRLAGTLLAASVAALFAGSCTNDHKSLTGPLKGLAHVPAFSTSTLTSSGASFTTDKDDYSPGETANLSGTGWQPADVLDIHLTVDPVTHDPVDWTVTIDSAGGFTSSYLVQDTDAGTTLTITATSEATGESATATFTDNPCPASVPTTAISSSFLAFTKSTSGSTITYGVATSNQSPTSNVPGLLELCVYHDGTVQTPAASNVQALYDSWTATVPVATRVEFSRPGGDPTDLPFDGNSYDVGKATYSTLPTSEIIVGHINSVAQCGTAPDGGTTCFRVLSPQGSGGQATNPTISKDASGSYKNTYTWAITKDVDKTLVEQIGGNATFNYAVNVSHDDGTISNVKVTGTITVSNPNTADITGANVTDALSAAGSSCSVTSGTGIALTPGDNTFAYSCSLTGLPLTAPDNKATVTWPAQTVAGNSLAAGSADFTFSGVSFTKDDIDECVSVSDSYAGTLGMACVGDANPKLFTYSRTVPVPQFDCQSYNNTATFTTNDQGVTGSASQTVKVCGPAKTGALTIGFWKTTNGQNLIKTYCANTLDDYLAGLGGGSGPFSDASGKNCTQLATYVFNILSGASATDMNKMLKAQMLGTALDVWFSGPGWTSTKIGGVKPPSNFLSHINLGTFNMDVTAVCPMVDNTTTGTATCLNNKPSTDAVASGAVPNSPMSMQAILDFAATTPSPFNGSTISSVWYGGDRTKEEILKNIFDQFNNQMAFGSF